jgi:hypothetical protein
MADFTPLELEVFKEIAILFKAYMRSAKQDGNAFVQEIESIPQDKLDHLVLAAGSNAVMQNLLLGLASSTGKAVGPKAIGQASVILKRIEQELRSRATALQSGRGKVKTRIESIVKPIVKKKVAKDKIKAQELTRTIDNVLVKYSKKGRNVITGLEGTPFESLTLKHNQITSLLKRYVMVRFWDELAPRLRKVAIKHAKVSTGSVRREIGKHLKGSGLGASLQQAYETYVIEAKTSGRGTTKPDFNRYIRYSQPSGATAESIVEDFGESPLIRGGAGVRVPGKEIYSTLWLGLEFGDMDHLDKVRTRVTKRGSGDKSKNITWPFWMILEYGTFGKFSADIVSSVVNLDKATRTEITNRFTRRKRKVEYCPVMFRNGQFRMMPIVKIYKGLRAAGQHSDILSKKMFDKERWIKRPEKIKRETTYNGTAGIHFIQKGFMSAIPPFKGEIQTTIAEWRTDVAVDVRAYIERYINGDQTVMDELGASLGNQRVVSNIKARYRTK